MYGVGLIFEMERDFFAIISFNSPALEKKLS